VAWAVRVARAARELPELGVREKPLCYTRLA
jgi:hypothetical protein